MVIHYGLTFLQNDFFRKTKGSSNIIHTSWLQQSCTNLESLILKEAKKVGQTDMSANREGKVCWISLPKFKFLVQSVVPNSPFGILNPQHSIARQLASVEKQSDVLPGSHIMVVAVASRKGGWSFSVRESTIKVKKTPPKRFFPSTVYAETDGGRTTCTCSCAERANRYLSLVVFECFLIDPTYASQLINFPASLTKVPSNTTVQYVYVHVCLLVHAYYKAKSF